MHVLIFFIVIYNLSNILNINGKFNTCIYILHIDSNNFGCCVVWSQLTIVCGFGHGFIYFIFY